MKDYSVSHSFTNALAFPDTKAINSTTPTAKDGTEFVKVGVDDDWGVAQALMYQAGLTPDGNDEVKDASQRMEAVVRLVSLGVLFVDSGVADAYVLDASGTIQAPTAYHNGMQVAFFTSNPNAGASTVNVAVLGDKDVRKVGGAVLPDGYIRTDQLNTMRYNLSAGYFELEDSLAFGSIQGDGTPGLKLRHIQLEILDGTNADTVKATVIDEFNGDAIAQTDNIAKNATTGDFTFETTGRSLSFPVTGDAKMVFATVTVNGPTAPQIAGAAISGGDIVVSLSNSSGTIVASDIAGLVDTGSATIRVDILYLTDA